MKSSHISWRYILWCFGELSDDEWVTANNFASLFNIVSVHSLHHHLAKLRQYCFIRTKYAVFGKVNRRGSRIQEYQITENGKKKLEYLVKLGNGILLEKREIRCPQCGFHTSVPELEFIIGLNRI